MAISRLLTLVDGAVADEDGGRDALRTAPWRGLRLKRTARLAVAVCRPPSAWVASLLLLLSIRRYSSGVCRSSRLPTATI